MIYIIIKHKSKSKSIVFGSKNLFFLCEKRPLYDVYWGAKAYILDSKSILIGDLTHVNSVQNDEFKADNALKFSPFFLFSNFILSKKMNWFNKQKVC